MKILLTGPHLSGKSTLIRRLAGKQIISIEVNGTTVGLDHGIAEVMGVPVRLFGTPGLARFKVLRRIISEGADGIFFVVDASNPDGDAEARYIWTEISDLMPTVPCIIAANKQDLHNARTPERIRHDLSFMVGVPVIPVSATTGINVDKLLGAMMMLIVFEWSPLLRAFTKSSGQSFKELAKNLGVTEQQIRSYLRWFELRKMIIVDWDKQSARLAKGVDQLLRQW
ncbi:MAG: ATP/GTP-binding protein [Promethearchaeota archaeon]